VGVATGVVLFILSGEKSDSTAASVQPFVGIGSLGLRGTF
jgi:hypothetical protein